jgi:DNA helicase-2/ATP-dependent DNA helicase PcrA
LTQKDRRFPRKSTLQKIISLSANTITPIGDIVARYYPHFFDELEEIGRIQTEYQDYKEKNNLCDYDDLLLKLVEVLTNHENIREKLSRKYRYIMVDEYQDTNRIQSIIIRRLAYSHDNVMVVGDDSQSIYSFRGANFKNIMNFPEDFPDSQIITLEQNYRSTPQILDLTNMIIERAAEKYPKHLFTELSDGEVPNIVPTRDEPEQSYFIASKVLQLWEEGVPLNQIAVLFRASSHSFELEVELAKRNIPFVKYGGLKFIETAHVKDIICHLRILNNSTDMVSWMRVLLMIEGIGNKTAQEIADHISKEQDVAEALRKYKGKPRYKNRLKPLAETIFQIRSDKVYPAEKISLLLKYYQPLLERKYDDHPKRLRDLEHLVLIAEKYRRLNSFLVDMALEPPNASVKGMISLEEDPDRLNLSTIHSAKGLEWHTVFILWAVDGKFPSLFSVNDEDDLEEERRLMYVATTRSKQNLFICYPMQIYSRNRGTIMTEPSMFIRSMPESVLEPLLLE